MQRPPSCDWGALLCRVKARPRSSLFGPGRRKGERGHAAPIIPDGDAQSVVTYDTTTPASLIEAGVAVCWSGVVDERRCLLLCEYRVATVLVARCVAHIKLLDCERREFVREIGRDFGRDVRLFADGAHDRVSFQRRCFGLGPGWSSPLRPWPFCLSSTVPRHCQGLICQ